MDRSLTDYLNQDRDQALFKQSSQKGSSPSATPQPDTYSQAEAICRNDCSDNSPARRRRLAGPHTLTSAQARAEQGCADYLSNQ